MVTWLDGGSPVISGSDAQVKPGSYQYTVSGGNGPYTWSVSGTGASINSSGLLTLGSGACGSILVTCTDCTGRASSQYVRVSNNGKWSSATICNCTHYGPMGGMCSNEFFMETVISGNSKCELFGELFHSTWWHVIEYAQYPDACLCLPGGICSPTPVLWYIADSGSCPYKYRSYTGSRYYTWICP